MDNVIKVPEPEMTDYGRAQYATEVAFSGLINTAGKMGLKLKPCVGLMYLPSQEVTQQFRAACEAVLNSLKVAP